MSKENKKFKMPFNMGQQFMKNVMPNMADILGTDKIFASMLDKVSEEFKDEIKEDEEAMIIMVRSREKSDEAVIFVVSGKEKGNVLGGRKVDKITMQEFMNFEKKKQ